jgi:hypothetical protein
MWSEYRIKLGQKRRILTKKHDKKMMTYISLIVE